MVATQITGTQGTTTTTTVAPTTVSSNNTKSTGFDYNSMFGPSMANDYFGSQAFGNSNIFAQQTTNTATQPTQTAQTTQTLPTEAELASAIAQIYGTPSTIGSALLQNHMLQSAGQELAYYNTALNTNTTATTQTAVPTTQQTTASTTTQTQPTSTNAGTPTMQDYMIGSQIANQFANDIPLTSTQTSYTSNDYFANQAFGQNNFQNVQANPQAANLSYAA